MLHLSSYLPFPRGRTASDKGLVTLSDSWCDYLEGTMWVVQDTIHKSAVPTHLMIVKNDSTAAITVARLLYKFSTTDAYDFGRRIAGLNTTAGGICVPIDDAYAVGFSIPDNDLFYVIVRGFATLTATASSPNLYRGLTVLTSDNAGKVTEAAAGNFPLGISDTTTQVASAQVNAFIDIDFRKEYGS